MQNKVTPKEVTLDDLKLVKVDSVLNLAYIVHLDVPLAHLQRKEPGFLLSFNVVEPALYEAALCASGMQLLEVQDGRALISVTIGDPYVSMFRRELMDAEDTYIVLGPVEIKENED